MNNKNKRGFTLIEVLVVIGIIAILSSVALVAINPARQFAQARNSQRVSNITAIVNAIGQESADHRGIFTCAAGAIPTSPTPIKSGEGGYNLRPCLVPDYLPEIPLDPSKGTIEESGEYASGYTIFQNTASKRITVAAPEAELGESISLAR